MQPWKESEFLAQLAEWRKMLGEKSFWDKNEDQHLDAIRGIAFVYTNVVRNDGAKTTQEDIDRWANWFNQAMDEYNRRRTMLIMLPLKRHLGLVKA